MDNPTKGRGRKNSVLGPGHRMPFGKYAGLHKLRQLARVDPDYLVELARGSGNIEFSDSLWFLIEQNYDGEHK